LQVVFYCYPKLSHFFKHTNKYSFVRLIDLCVSSDVPMRLKTVRLNVQRAHKSSTGVCTGLVQIVAVSKLQSDSNVDLCLSSGHRVFGENRVQEAQQRWSPRRPHYHDLKLHLIGPLQTNKAADAVALFDVIEVVDRPKLAKILSDEMRRQDRYLPCYIQVNTGEEPQKSGVLPADLDDFVAYCRDQCALQIEGLMCIPPADEEPAMHFALLRDMARRHNISGLSMGMSADYEDAIAFGATSIRVGSAIFGERDQ
jgi:pyridoxal phosphate enzyme (YggS family)